MSYRKINLTINAETGRLIDPNTGSVLVSSQYPVLFYGEIVILCLSFVDSDLNAYPLNTTDVFIFGGDSNFSHADDLMVYSDNAMVDIAGDWDSVSRPSGKISVRVNCFTEEFETKIGSLQTLVMYVMLKRLLAGDVESSVFLSDTFTAKNVVMVDEGSPVSSEPEYYTAIQVNSLLATKISAASNLSDLASVSTARANLGLAASAVTDTTNASNISSGTLDAARLPASGVTAGSYGSATTVPVPTVDASGRITAMSTATISSSSAAAWGSVTGTLSSQTDLQTALDAKLSAASNLSDLASASTARTNLGLVASAVTDTTNASNISSGTLDATRLPASGVTAGSYGSSTAVPVPTVDAYGRITAMSTATISSGGGTITDNPQTAAYTQTATGQQIRFTSAVTAACALTLMTPPSNNSAPTYVKNESNYVITLSGAINGAASTTLTLAPSVSLMLVSDGTYWRVSRLDDAMPDISSAATGKIASVTSNIVSSGGLAKWTLNNVLTDSFGSYTLTNSGLTFASDSSFPLGSQYVAGGSGSSYATFTPASLPSGASVRTLCGWIKSSSASTQFIVGYGATSSGNEVGLGIYSDGKPYFEIYGSELFGTGSLANGSWHHLAMTYNGSTVSLYVDGVFNKSSSMTLNTSLTWGNIGSIRNGTSKINGSLADVRIYNRVLSAAEISRIYSGDVGSSWQFSSSAALQNIAGRSATAPTIAAGSGAGTSPTVSIAGSDCSGQISVTTGTAPTAAATIATVTFASTFPNTPYIMISPANANAAALTGATQVYAASTTTAATLTAGSTALTASTSYVWNFKIN